MMKLDDHYHIKDMLAAALLVEEFIDSASGIEDFEHNVMCHSAVIRQLEIIGEASNRVSNDFKTQHSEFPWVKMISMRNKLIHAYHEVDLKLVWKTALNHIPALIKAAKEILK